MPDLGGVYLSVGIDISKVRPAMEQVKGQLQQFRRGIGQLEMEGLIKGDPFSAQRKQFKKMEGALDKVWKQWKDGVNTTEVVLDKFTRDSMRNAEQMIRRWEKVSTVFHKMQRSLAAGKGAGAGLGIFGQIGGMARQARAAPGGGVAGTELGEKIGKQLGLLKKRFKNITPEIDKEIRRLDTVLATGTGNIYDKMNPALKKLRGVIESEYKKIAMSHRKAGVELKKSIDIQKGLKTDMLTKQAKSEAAARQRQAKATEQLRIEEAKLRAELQIGMNVRQNRAALMKNMQKRREVGLGLTRKEGREVKRLEREYERLNNAKQRMFSPEWIRTRLRWFVQLRLAWQAWRVAGDVMRDLINWQNQMARAMRTARSETLSTTQIVEQYGAAMKGAVAAHGVTWTEAGEALYQFGSAGLSAEESMAALNSTLSLVVATEGDVREVTKGIAGIYNVFGDQITHATTLQEKFNHINEIVAQTWSRHQVEISELIQGFRLLSSMGRVAGLSFETMAASLGVLNDNMIKSGRAGRSMQNVLMRMARAPLQFAEAFDVAFDPTKPLQFNDIMEELSLKMKGGEQSAYDLATAFERLGLRGAPAFVTLVRNWDKVKDSMLKFQTESQKLTELENVMLDTLEGRWKQMLGNLRSLVVKAGPIADFLKYITEAGVFFGRQGRGAALMGQLNKIDEGNVEARRAWWKKRTIEEKKAIDIFIDSIVGAQEQKIDDLQISIAKNQKKLEAGGGLLGSKTLLKAELLYQKTSLVRLKKNLKDLIATTQVGALHQEREANRAMTKAEERQKRRKLLADKEAADAKKAAGLDYGGELRALQARVGITTEKVAQIIYKDINTSFAERIEFREKEIALMQGKVKLMQQARDNAEKDKQDASTLVAADKEIEKQKAKILAANKELTAERIRQLEVTKREISAALRAEIAGKERALAPKEGKTQAELNKDAIPFIERIRDLRNQIYDIEFRIATLRSKDFTTAAAQERLNKQLRDKRKEEREALINQKKAEKETVKLTLLANKKLLLDMQLQLEVAKQMHAGEKIEIELRKKIVELQIQQLENAAALLPLGSLERKRLENEAAKADIQLAKLEQRAMEIEKPWVGAFNRIKESMLEAHQIMEQQIQVGIQGMADGLGAMTWNAVSGFQEQQQEVVNLQAELQGLQQEYDEAIGQGQVDRAAEIANEMARLRGEISDLENPITQLKERFKVFFKDLIDQISQAIIKWLILKAIMGIAGAGASTPYIPAVGGGGVVNTGGGKVFGSGGFANFASFARGGVTSRPQLALLGDNKSNQEIVIPTENIKSDSVSGYAREAEQPINIVNLFTEEDLIRTMSGDKGQKTIINTIGRDMRNKGPTYRSQNA